MLLPVNMGLVISAQLRGPVPGGNHGFASYQAFAEEFK